MAAGTRLREILDHDLFDLQSHSFTHDNMVAIRDDAAAVHLELVDSKRVIEDLFGREVIGFTAPGGFGHGFLGEARLLEALWEAGYRYVRTVSWQPNNLAPAPLTPPSGSATTATPNCWRSRLMLGTTVSSPASRRRWHGLRRCRGGIRHGSPPPSARCTKRTLPASSTPATRAC